MYGRCDKARKLYVRPLSDTESMYTYTDSMRYAVVYKKEVKIGGKSYLLNIAEARNSNLHGHQLGFTDFCFLKKNGTKWETASLIVSKEEMPVGDIREYDVVEIGLNKQALVSTFQSTGNNHFERNITLSSLTLSAMPFLLQVDLEYSNEGFIAEGDTTVECEIRESSCEYEILKSAKEWFDVKVHKTVYTYNKGCFDRYVLSEEDILYIHDGKKYVQR